jgi:hypothetical protein
MDEKNNFTGYWWGKLEGKKPLGRRKGGRVDNIKMAVTATRWSGMN